MQGFIFFRIRITGFGEVFQSANFQGSFSKGERERGGGKKKKGKEREERKRKREVKREKGKKEGKKLSKRNIIPGKLFKA